MQTLLPEPVAPGWNRLIDREKVRFFEAQELRIDGERQVEFPEECFHIALCVEGKKMGSGELANLIDKVKSSAGEITFVIGSSYGLGGSVKERADFKLSLSDMTFPHTLARLILTEQIYRALNIISGGKYHK